MNGTELKVKSTPRNKPMKVEIKYKDGDTGKAQVQMYNPGRKGATLLVTKASGEGFNVVKTVSDEFIEKFLNLLMKGLVKGEEEMKRYIQTKSEVKDSDIFKCDKCEKGFSTKHGLSIHSAWHTKNNFKKNQDSQISANSKPADTPLTENKLQSSMCEWCEEMFQGELKYQSINSLLIHKNSCINKPKQQPIVKVIKNCDICDYIGSNEKDLMNHNQDQHLNKSDTTSPPPKKKRTVNDNEESDYWVMDTDEIVIKISNLDIKEKSDNEEEKELKRRSDLMDKKVEGIKRRREEEEKQYRNMKELKEKNRLENEEADRVKNKEKI